MKKQIFGSEDVSMELLYLRYRNPKLMERLYSWPWVEAQVARTIEAWTDGAGQTSLAGQRYHVSEQREREIAYDEALRAVEREVKRRPRSKAERLQTQARITAAFARFSATALGLENDATDLLTHDFLPVGTRLARWARRFDPTLSMADIVQACRNAWTACGLQPLLGDRLGITPSILGYSLLYPYSDNYLDRADVSAEAKMQFSERFRDRLRGDAVLAENDRETSIWGLVRLIEEQYPRVEYSEVFECLLAIHRAQEQSIAQLGICQNCDDADLLAMSCAKGGSSVMADACLSHGSLSLQESEFSFAWGVLLQLGDDLQDVRADIDGGSVTLFTRTAAEGQPLDSLVLQLLSFSEQVGTWMDDLPNGPPMLKGLLRMSWRSLIIGAIAESHQFFSPSFVNEAEQCSRFRYAFLRARNKRLARRQGLYATVLDAFLAAPGEDQSDLALPKDRKATCFDVEAILSRV